MAPLSLAAQDTIPRKLPAVTVTRDVSRSPLELPYAITSVQPDSLAPGQTHAQVEQTLAFVPGLTVANRNNPSQDARVSIRGFGARSPFGVRSIRVLRDGMPLTLPDGQTPIDYLDLEAVGRVETIRGSASALYGNASGGVIDIRSATPPTVPLAVQARTWSGSDGFRRHAAMLGGNTGVFSYSANVGRSNTEGYRDYARHRLTNGFLRAETDVAGTRVSLVALGLDQPLAENPGALTRAQFESSPRMADPLQATRLARKEVQQSQVGLSASRALAGDGELFAQAYGAARDLYNPLAFAIVAIDRRVRGASLRATVPLATGAVEHRLTVGADAQQLDDLRKNWSNCNGVVTVSTNCPVIGVEQGRLQLDQREIVTGVGPYVRHEIDIGRLRLTAGLRADYVIFELRDFHEADGRNDSGRRELRAVSPMFGVAALLSPLHTLYANASSAFETPTTTELGNHPDGSAGLNRDLHPQYSTTYEAGTKGLAFARVQYDVALFTTSVRDELIQFEVPGGGGRTFFRNAGRTRRQGIETSVLTEAGALTLVGAYSYSRFRFRDFTVGTTQHAGNAIPGIPEHQAQAGITWRPAGSRLFAVGELLAKSKVYVNDANEAAAPGHAVVNLRLGSSSVLRRGWLTPVIGVQNVFDRKYVGSVAVNAAGTVATAKFYEPAPGRTWFVGVSAATEPW